MYFAVDGGGDKACVHLVEAAKKPRCDDVSVWRSRAAVTPWGAAPLSSVHTRQWLSRQKTSRVSWSVCQADRAETISHTGISEITSPPPTCLAQSIRIIDTNICKLAFRRARRWKHLVKRSCTILMDLNAYSTNGKEDSRGTRLWISVLFNFFVLS